MSKAEFSIGRRAFLGLGLPAILLACKEQSSPTTPSNPAKGAENVDIIDHEQKQSLEFLSYWFTGEMLRYGVVYDRDKSGYGYDTDSHSQIGLRTNIVGSLGKTGEFPVRFSNIYDRLGASISSVSILSFGNSREIFQKSEDFLKPSTGAMNALKDVAGADRIARSVFKHIPEGSVWTRGEMVIGPRVPVSTLETQFSIGEFQIKVYVQETRDIVLAQTVK